MIKLNGHALILAAGAVGVVVSLEILNSMGPARVARAGAAVAAVAPDQTLVAPVLKPLPASTTQANYTRVLISPADREMLARGIQRELRRVGCYRGEIDGTWGPQSRQAMGAFTSAVKLRIPFDAPDEMLLRLLKDHPQRACGGPDLDPEQASATPSVEASPRLVQPPTEMKRAPRRGIVNEPKPKDGEPATTDARVAESVPPSAPRRIERATAPPPSPTIVSSFMKTVSNVLGPLGF